LSTLKGFFKNTVIYGVASVLPRAITTLLTKLKTSVFEASNYSQDTSFYIYAAYLNVILTFGLETAFFRFFSKEKEKNKVISTAFVAILFSVLIFSIITLYFAESLSVFFNFSDPLYYKLLIYTLILDTIVVIPYAYLRANNRPVKFAFFKISNVLVYAILNVFFLWIVPKYNVKLPQFLVDYLGKSPQIIYVFFAGVVAGLFTFVLMLPIIFSFKFKFSKPLLRKMIYYGFPVMIAGIAYITNENLDKILIERFQGKNIMGIYSACYKLGVFMTLFITAFKLGAEPFFFNHSTHKDAKKNYAIILDWFVITGSLILFVIVAFLPLFAKIILGRPEYYQALKIVPIILLANLFLGIYHNLSVWYKLTDKTRYGMYFSIFGAILTVVLNLVFIPIYGYMASAWITLIAYGSMMSLSYFVSRKHYKVQYNIPKISFYLFLSTALAFLSFYKFQGNYIFSTFMLIIFLGIVYRKEVIPLLSNNQ
jgi:O-antigen/teichoic acid export membrane protein